MENEAGGGLAKRGQAPEGRETRWREDLNLSPQLDESRGEGMRAPDDVSAISNKVVEIGNDIAAICNTVTEEKGKRTDQSINATIARTNDGMNLQQKPETLAFYVHGCLCPPLVGGGHSVSG